MTAIENIINELFSNRNKFKDGNSRIIEIRDHYYQTRKLSLQIQSICSEKQGCPTLKVSGLSKDLSIAIRNKIVYVFDLKIYTWDPLCEDKEGYHVMVYNWQKDRSVRVPVSHDLRGGDRIFIWV
jgi:hypothetical protein